MYASRLWFTDGMLVQCDNCLIGLALSLSLLSRRTWGCTFQSVVTRYPKTDISNFASRQELSSILHKVRYSYQRSCPVGASMQLPLAVPGLGSQSSTARRSGWPRLMPGPRSLHTVSHSHLLSVTSFVFYREEARFFASSSLHV